MLFWKITHDVTIFKIIVTQIHMDVALCDVFETEAVDIRPKK
jgi:hypothetical protein